MYPAGFRNVTTEEWTNIVHCLSFPLTPTPPYAGTVKDFLVRMHMQKTNALKVDSGMQSSHKMIVVLCDLLSDNPLLLNISHFLSAFIIFWFLRKISSPTTVLVHAWLSIARSLLYIACSSLKMKPMMALAGNFVSFQWLILSTSCIALFLVNHGIPFSKQMQLAPQAFPVPLPVLQAPDCLTPVHLAGYQFTLLDYNSYQHQFTAILNCPHGHAALFLGSIFWCIACETLSFDAMLQGLSSMVHHYRKGSYCHQYVDPSEETVFYWDKTLNEDEPDIICGLHHCKTGKWQLFVQAIIWFILLVFLVFMC